MGKKSNRLPLEVRERAVRRLQDYRSEYPPLLAAIQRVYKIGSHCHTANGGLPAGQGQQHHRLQIDDFGQAVLQLVQQKALWQIHLKDRVQGGMRILRLAYWHAQTDRRIPLGRADLQVRGSIHWKAFSSL